ncbi:hypothetical protein H311_00421 [Anncaliia algerae PRA109]|nr:hypothetical protein H311_00421 [Anncaliia algerae PRA109]
MIFFFRLIICSEKTNPLTSQEDKKTNDTIVKTSSSSRKTVMANDYHMQDVKAPSVLNDKDSSSSNNSSNSEDSSTHSIKKQVFLQSGRKDAINSDLSSSISSDVDSDTDLDQSSISNVEKNISNSSGLQTKIRKRHLNKDKVSENKGDKKMNSENDTDNLEPVYGKHYIAVACGIMVAVLWKLGLFNSILI